MNKTKESKKTARTLEKWASAASRAKAEPVPPRAASGQSGLPWKANLLGEFISPPSWTFLDQKPAETIQWSKRARRALQLAKCKTLADICHVTREMWREQHRVGSKTIAEIESAIRAIIASRSRELGKKGDPRGVSNGVRKNRSRSRVSPSDRFDWHENLLGRFLPPADWTLLDAVPVTRFRWSKGALRAIQLTQCNTLGDICHKTTDSWRTYPWFEDRTQDEFVNAIRSTIAAGSPKAKVSPLMMPSKPQIEKVRAAMDKPSQIPEAVWNMVAKDLKAALPEGLTMGDAADLLGEECPPCGFDAPLQEFLADSPVLFFNFPGVGKKKTPILTRCLLKLWLQCALGPAKSNALLGENIEEIAADLTSGKFERGLTKAFKLARLKPDKIRILDLRYGLSDDKPRTLNACGILLGVTREAIRQIESRTKYRLTARPDLMSAMKRGLANEDARLRERISEVQATLKANAGPIIHFYRALNGWECLLIDLCHGDIITWLNQTGDAKSGSKPRKAAR